MPRVRLGTAAELPEEGGTVVRVPGGAPPRRSLVVVRDGAAVRAFWNVCRHLPVPLDSGVGVLPPDHDLVCLTHGARYRREDGLCLAGPCKGSRLEAVPVEADGEAWFALV
ncbi:MAG: Rieske 2Fe-2S domain-containing protein [Myxococcales bacterium]|nr:Rieske 2Fe-2S domain-containing protein [Myxococcales bacterium]MCB9648860.1 Rieske 2Fe-2S domain-containing protein [Deltaproteobacteria bacterium]